MGADLLAAGASTETLAALPVESNVVRRSGPSHTFDTGDNRIQNHVGNVRSVGLNYHLSIDHTSSMSKRDKPMPAASLYLMLALLGGENHGYALMQLVEEQSDGAVRMGPGTLYGTLNRLLGDGMIAETTAPRAPEDNERRRYYQLTADGDRVARTELHRLLSLVSRFNGIVGLGGIST